MTGRLIAVVGPSGVGKDTLIRALVAARPEISEVRRSITRPTDAHEACLSLSRAEFARQRDAGGFALSWEAHGLYYGVPADVLTRVQAGQDVIANLSRALLPAAMLTFPRVSILSLTAAPEVLAERLGARGREAAAEIARRLARGAPPMPEGAEVITIDNGGPLEASVATALAALTRQASL
ncbi:phosphonate metabolism protein/1,5-bisphosphokinase (PRPP-forming) PhnN [Puniceibacterium sediminis]|uniref:Ribose 1,5-bisphosphate phosphokinase PhnN n=1 Tax=Puniceibacterium sediminis TaxID=1608407 RepID=A0A238V1U3_9RHOB|nr:phosphonate metabolism protein/1,5-bisphosphokinase (PRPP-forming) PhnN [Puniceibacterium sediminis]SNR28410.1 ribose 1,5-bisphosphokinase [Puniceibacterium sediminis]